MKETALSYEYTWTDRLVNWIFEPKNWLALVLMFLIAHGLLFLVAWLTGWVALPDKGLGLIYAIYLAAFNAGVGVALIIWSLIKNHEMGVGSAGYIIGSLIGGAIGSVLVMVLGGLWRIVELIFSFSASPSPIVWDVIAGLIAVLVGLLAATVASSG